MNVQYGSLSHYILNYAKMRFRMGDGTFKLEDYHNFRHGNYPQYLLKRSVSTLVKHGHLQKLADDKFIFTENGMKCAQLLQNAHSNKLYDDAKKRNPSARRLLAERLGEDI
jgi:hypothetical protein